MRDETRRFLTQMHELVEAAERNGLVLREMTLNFGFAAGDASDYYELIVGPRGIVSMDAEYAAASLGDVESAADTAIFTRAHELELDTN